jgi:hypothetical protein
MIYVYPLGKGSRWFNNEVLISIDLLKRYAPTATEIVLIGTGIPDHISKGCTVIEIGDRSNKPQNNVIHKLHEASKIIKEPFVLMNDDFFLTRTIDSFPKYHSGKLRDKIKTMEKIPSIYVQGMRKALEFLIQKGHNDPLNYMIHAPYLVEDVRTFQQICLFILNNNGNYSLRQIYLSLTGGETIDLPYDPKIQRSMLRAHEVEAFTQHCPWFSISDSFLNNFGKQYLETL